MAVATGAVDAATAPATTVHDAVLVLDFGSQYSPSFFATLRPFGFTHSARLNALNPSITSGVS